MIKAITKYGQKIIFIKSFLNSIGLDIIIFQKNYIFPKNQLGIFKSKRYLKNIKKF